jgi:hypothetical protein
MDRRAVVLIVSRALAMFTGIFALLETSYLPERLYAYLHYVHEANSSGEPASSFYLPNLYRLEAGFLFVRILIYLILTLIFWKCGPWVARILSPERAKDQASLEG